MSTTRHLINRQRRLAAVRTPPAPAPDPGPPEDKRDEKPVKPPRRPARERAAPRRRAPLVAVLAAVTVLLGAFAGWAAAEAGGIRDSPGAGNAALTDPARTSQALGVVNQAVNEVFSYNHAKPEKLDRAVGDYLTGEAVEQHRELLARVLAEGQEQKLVLTTTVTDSGVVLIGDDRARVLIYADQSNTRTTEDGGTSYAAAMFVVDAVRRDGTWKIANIDTFN